MAPKPTPPSVLLKTPLRYADGDAVGYPVVSGTKGSAERTGSAKNLAIAALNNMIT